MGQGAAAHRTLEKSLQQDAVDVSVLEPWGGLSRIR